jgi:4-alpha-glucanotransferase
MRWANFLHIYQPPTQKEIWVRRVADESYRKVLAGVRRIPRARFTLNINGILCELLEKYGGGDVLGDIRALLRSGNIELTGSAKYHAFLPLLPEDEIERQIRLNEESLTHYFGNDWKKGGFFAPEMGYSEKVAKVVAGLGYQWIVIDELAFPEGVERRTDRTYTVKGLDDFGVFFRERSLSFMILSAQAGTMPAILKYLGPRVEGDGYAVTAMDGETFGHHRPGLEELLFDLFKEPRVEPVSLSDLRKLYPQREAVTPRDSTWAATEKEMELNMPFARWKRDDNAIQERQWELTDLAIRAVHGKKSDSATRKLLDEALHSDQYWWASMRPWWSLEMIERGAHELRNVVLGSPNASAKENARAEELYKEIVYTGFEWQRSGLVDEISRSEDEGVRENLEMKEKLYITKEEYEHMIDTLAKQMKEAAKGEEFYRAGMLKDRIRELKEDMRKVGEKIDNDGFGRPTPPLV